MPLIPTSSPHPGPVAFLFLDLETSQLDPDAPGACVLEIAWVAVDADLRTVAEYSALVRPSPDMILSDWSRDNLDPRLTEAARPGDTRHTWTHTVRKLAMSLDALRSAPYRLAGWSPHFDLSWLKREAWLAPMLSHRVWDMSTVAHLCDLWQPGLVARQSKSKHRALDDCRNALAWLREYRLQLP